MTESHHSSTSISQRLPNHARTYHVPPEKRKRVKSACDPCHHKRVKCSGGKPCERCQDKGLECKTSPPSTEAVLLRTRSVSLEKKNKRLQDHLKEICATVQRHAPHLISQLPRGELPDWDAIIHDLPTSPGFIGFDDNGGRLLADDEWVGRYLGDSSGAAFLDRLRLLLYKHSLVPDSGDVSTISSISIGRYQTYDSRPLPDPDVNPGWLPTPEEMVSMLRNLSRYIQDGNGAFISGGILWWGDLVNVPRSDPLAHLRMIDGSPGLAFYHVCFALSVLIEHVPLHLPATQTAETYFTRARKLIGDPSITNHALADVPALTLMAFYLIEVNRRDLAAKYVGLAALAVSAHGAHRFAESEARKREFWTLFILDRWISMLMGRPPTIMEESIRLRPPADDPNERMPPCAGLYANVELARVSGYVVQEVYRVAPRTPKRADEVNTDEALRRLHDWLARLPTELQLEAHPDLPRRDPPCCTMHMSYNQLIILTTRQIFFDAIKEVIELAQQGSNSSSSVRRKTHEKYIRVCIEAAQRNVLLADQMHSTPGRWLQSSLHFLFNAAVILLLDRISSAYDERAKTDVAARGLHREATTFAIDVFRKEAGTGTNYQADCCKVLQDLQALSRPVPQHTARVI